MMQKLPSIAGMAYLTWLNYSTFSLSFSSISVCSFVMRMSKAQCLRLLDRLATTITKARADTVTAATDKTFILLKRLKWLNNRAGLRNFCRTPLFYYCFLPLFIANTTMMNTTATTATPMINILSFFWSMPQFAFHSERMRPCHVACRVLRETASRLVGICCTKQETIVILQQSHLPAHCTHRAAGRASVHGIIF